MSSEGSSTSDPKGKSSITGLLKKIFSCSSEDDDDEITKGVEPVPFTQLFRFSTTSDRILILIGVICAVTEGALGPSIQFLMGRVDTIYIQFENPTGNSSFLRQVLTFAGIYLATGLLIFVISSIEHFILSYAAEKMIARIRRLFLESTLGQDAIFLDSTTSGALSNQLNNSIDRIRDAVGDKIGMLTRSSTFYFSALIGAFITEWRVTLIMIALGPVCCAINAVVPVITQNLMRETLQIAEDAGGIADEAISNVKTVAACNGQETMIERYSKTLRSGISPAVRLGSIVGFFEGFFYFLLYALYIAGLWYGLNAYKSGVISNSGDILAVINVLMFSSYILGILTPHMTAILKARVSAAVVYKIIDRVPSIDITSSTDGLSPPDDTTIAFSNVTFAYPTRPDIPVLKGLSWSATAGQTVALVGRSGCGKSTSIGLLTRVFNAGAGSISVGGRPLQDYNVRQLRTIIGIVSQEPNLFHGTIRENIELGRDLSDEAVKKAAHIANAHEFIVGLEKGYDTLLGPAGVALSGGQKQRIAIARAMATNPRILLLDEATSALDTQSERVVQAALNKASSGRTTLVVAHRLSTIKHVDRVYVLDGGIVVEEGSYADLVAKEGGIFAGMVALQDVEKNHDRIVEEEEDDVVMSPSKNLFIGKEESEDLHASVPMFTGARGTSIAYSSVRSQRSQPRKESRMSEVSAPDTVYPTLTGGVFSLLLLDKPRVLLQILASCARGSEMVLFSVVWIFLFRAFTEEEYVETMRNCLISLTVLGLFVWATVVTSRATGALTSENVMHKLRVRCLSSLLHRPVAYFDRQETSTAACAVALSQQPAIANAALDYRASLLYENVFSLLCLTIMCFAYCWPNGLVCLFCAVLYAGLFMICQHFEQSAHGVYEKVDTSGEFAIEIFENVRTIQLLSVSDWFIDRFVAVQEASSRPMNKRGIFRAITHGTSQCFFFINAFIATSIGCALVYRGFITVNQQFISEMCVMCVGWAVMLMAGSLNDIIGAVSAASASLALIDPTRTDLDSGDKPNIKGRLEARTVDFAYPSRPQHRVAKGLNFVVPAGKSLSLVGPSGSGKSTIVNLLERFYEPTNGTISIDDTPLPSIAVKHLRSRIGLVGQEPILFRGTIAENVAFGCPDATLEDVREACKLANAAQFVEAFPQGYDTSLGERGRSLSGGQKQRIAIARALIRRPAVILLDEATSALDSQSEKVVKAALESTAKGRTCVAIAHRLDTIKDYDEICFVERGAIVERGSHAQLMARQGKYAALVAQQTLT